MDSQIITDMEQSERLREAGRFRPADPIICRSDVRGRAARHSRAFSHVFNFDVPWHPDDYVHSVGPHRSARAPRAARSPSSRRRCRAVAAIES